jgi:type I restriction enzyme S subunit
MAQGIDLVKTREQITELAVAECGGRLVAPGTLVMSFKLSVGKLGFVRVPMYTNEAIAALPIRKGKKVDPRFLHRALQIARLSDGADRAVKGLTLNSEKLARVPITYPEDLDEQRRITDILDRGDAIRRKRRQAITLTEELLRSAFFNMFGDPVTNPMGWTKTTLDDVSTLITDGEHSTPQRSAKGIMLLSARNVKHGFIDLNEKVDYVPMHEWERMRVRCAPKLGDLLLSCSGTIGRVTVVRIDVPFGLVRSVAVIRLKRDRAVPEFIEAFLATPQLQREMLKSANQSAQANLFLGQIGRLRVLLPPLKRQSEFGDFVARVRVTAEVKAQALAEADGLFSALAQRSFRGDV